MKEGSVTMTSSAANPKILYRNSRLLRMVFLQLHRQQRADLFCDVVLQAEGTTNFFKKPERWVPKNRMDQVVFWLNFF